MPRRVKEKYERSEVWVAYQALHRGCSWAEAAEEASIPQGALNSLLRKYGFKKPLECENIVKRAHEAVMSGHKVKEVAGLLGTNRGHLWVAFKRFNLPTPLGGVRRLGQNLSFTYEVAKQASEELRTSKLPEVATRYKLSKEKFKRLLKEFKLPTRYRHEPQNIWLSKLSKDQVRSAHTAIFSDEKSTYDAQSAILNTSTANLRSLFIKLGLPISTRKLPWSSTIQENEVKIAFENIKSGKSKLKQEALRLDTTRQNLRRLINRVADSNQALAGTPEIIPATV